MSRIGLLVIATNKYIQFVPPLWESVQKNFLTKGGHKVNMYVFTNNADVPQGTIRIEQEHLPWPGPTLKRYHMFLKRADIISSNDYLFYLDADMLVTGEVGDEILGDLVATRHPGFFDKPRQLFTYEKRKESACYVPPDQGTTYFAGGFNGGTSRRYLEMARACASMIDKDESNNIIPVWQDESSLNRYLINTPPSIVLSPAYCYQEEATLPFPRKIIALYKNHAEMRS